MIIARHTNRITLIAAAFLALIFPAAAEACLVEYSDAYLSGTTVVATTVLIDDWGTPGCEPNPGWTSGWTHEDYAYIELTSPTGRKNSDSDFEINYASGNVFVEAIAVLQIQGESGNFTSTREIGSNCSEQGCWNCPGPEPGPPVPVGSVSITNADIVSDDITVFLSPSNIPSGNLTVKAVMSSGSTVTLFSGPKNPGTHSFLFKANQSSSLTTGAYSSVTATWQAGQGQRTESFDYLGVWRHSQYNTPNEAGCVGSPTDAYITNNSCQWNATTLKSDFIGQAWLNGSGITNSNGPVQVEDWCFTNSTPPGDVDENAFRDVVTIVAPEGPLNNSTLAQGDNKPFGWGASILIRTIGTKTVTDLCDECTGLQQLDNYTTDAACVPGSIPDLGDFETFLLL